MRYIILILIAAGCILACAQPQRKPIEVNLRFESDIPIVVVFEKNCEGNWNFCQYE